jgi:hypothetical protein
MQLFHYTSREGLEGIQQSGCILPSKGRGHENERNGYRSGVFLQTLDPNQHSKEEIARDSYRHGGASHLKEGKLDHYLEFEIPETIVERVRDNVYCYAIGNLHLPQYPPSSQGSNASWAMAMVFPVGIAVAAAVVTAGSALYTSAWGSWNRWQAIYNENKLKQELQAIIQKYRSFPMLQLSVQTRNYHEDDMGPGFLIYCKDCARAVTRPSFVKTPVDKQKIEEELKRHYAKHLIDGFKKALMPTLVVVVAIVVAVRWYFIA